jgi:hypothetical protein
MSTILEEVNTLKSLAQKELEATIRRTENIISYYNVRKITFDPVLVELEANLQVVNVSLCSDSIDVKVAGDKKVLNIAFGVLRKFKFEPENRPKDSEPSFTTYFNHSTGARIWFSFSSTVCKRVQVGMKTVEQPIYETVCE